MLPSTIYSILAGTWLGLNTIVVSEQVRSMNGVGQLLEIRSQISTVARH